MYFAYTCGGVHLEQVEQASAMEFTTSRIEEPKARRSCDRSLENSIQLLPHRRLAVQGGRFQAFLQYGCLRLQHAFAPYEAV